MPASRGANASRERKRDARAAEPSPLVASRPLRALAEAARRTPRNTQFAVLLNTRAGRRTPELAVLREHPRAVLLNTRATVLALAATMFAARPWARGRASAFRVGGLEASRARDVPSPPSPLFSPWSWPFVARTRRISSRRRARRAPSAGVCRTPPPTAARWRASASADAASGGRRASGRRRRRGLDVTTRRRARASAARAPPPGYSPNFGRRFERAAADPPRSGRTAPPPGDGRRPDDDPTLETSPTFGGVNARRRDAARSAARRRAHARSVADAETSYRGPGDG